ncbi:HyaD/HybD family hydrogenase maturation endopeptidase [Sulfurospirillum deleyianum]|uniref:Hydrogenase maturation protease n=1 Tax=Sulfurospirillum deleyianum (strain ATCC 51133 / DSM 6946 / 5175) TaxID=525898 RepID=D1B207_SULD5|nr:HyaD/HybD family hydrogenase maturation endopeptidase [Sulfurospirillum deleyianum]ACZ12127.1 hydrogenase maturation protease [Sulfurospirillum deleyianum DSM 6946]
MKVLVLGIGNVMFSDEGVGVHLCRLVEQKYAFSSDEHTLTFIDGGTLAERLIPIIAEYDYLIVLDCVDARDGEIGDVYFFDFENVPNSITWQGSVHEVEMLQTLSMMDLVGDRPPTKVVGIIPEVVDITTLQMTPAVLKGSEIMEKTLLKHLSELGFSYRQVKEIDIQSVADTSCLEER